MRSLLCISPRVTDIYEEDREDTVVPNRAGGIASPATKRLSTSRRRLSLQIGRHSNGSLNDTTSGSEGKQKKRRSMVTKESIGRPEGFKHHSHIGPTGEGLVPGDWDVNKWQADMEAIMNERPSSSSGAHSKLDGPRGRPASAGGLPSHFPPLLPLGSGNRDDFLPGPRVSMSAVPDKVTNAGGNLSRSSSANAAIPSPRRKPVPSALPPTAEVSPFPTLVLGSKPTTETSFAKPLSEQTNAPGSGPADTKPLPVEEEKPMKELVPLLGVPEGRVTGHEAHYVTKTAKARWDGAMSEIANALKDPDAPAQ